MASARERLIGLLRRPDKPQSADYSPREVTAICEACAEVAEEGISNVLDVAVPMPADASRDIRSALADAEKEAGRG